VASGTDGEHPAREDAEQALDVLLAGVAAHHHAAEAAAHVLREGVGADRRVEDPRLDVARHHVDGRGHAAVAPVLLEALAEHHEAVAVVVHVDRGALGEAEEGLLKEPVRRLVVVERVGHHHRVHARQVHGVDAHQGRPLRRWRSQSPSSMSSVVGLPEHHVEVPRARVAEHVPSGSGM
jgi:hypothetical protein